METAPFFRYLVKAFISWCFCSSIQIVFLRVYKKSIFEISKLKDMAFNAFREMNPWSQFIMTAFVMLISFLGLFVISLLIGFPVFGMDELLESLSGADLNNPQTIIILKYFQVVQSVGLFVIPPLIAAWLFEGNITQYLKLNRKVHFYKIILAVFALLAFSPFISYVGLLNSKMSLPGFLSGIETWMREMEDQATIIIDHFMMITTFGGLLFNLFMIAVIPAIGEELLFRGVIQKIFTDMTRNYHWGIWIAAFLFSALHMQFFGFIPRMLLGALFGYVLVFSGSLWLPVLCHFVNNTLGVLALHAGSRGHEEVEKIVNFDFGDGISYLWPLAILSLIFTVMLLRFLQKAETN